jgi:hypothetical protein
VGLVACMREESNVKRVLVRTSEGNRLLGGRRHRWEEGFKTSVYGIKLVLPGFIWSRTRVSGRNLWTQ